MKAIKKVKDVTPVVLPYGPTTVLECDFFEVKEKKKVGLKISLLLHFEQRTVKAVIPTPKTRSGYCYFGLRVFNGARFSNAVVEVIPMGRKGKEPKKSISYTAY